jgi:hypothetical protein
LRSIRFSTSPNINFENFHDNHTLSCILYINSRSPSVRDTTVPRFNPPAEPARTVGSGPDSRIRKLGSESARERDLTVREKERERERLGVGSETASACVRAWRSSGVQVRPTGPGLAKTGEGLTGCDGGQQGRAGHGRVPAGPMRAGHGRGADWLWRWPTRAGWARESPCRSCACWAWARGWLAVTVARAQCPFIEVLRAKYRGPETQVLRAKCSNNRVYCTSLCKNTAAATEEERGGDQLVKEPEWAMGRTGRPGQSDSETRQRAHERSLKNQGFAF